MVLVHVPEDRRDVTLIHFPRDLWVPIPGRGEAKLNAAYAFGGAPLLVKTMQNMLGIEINHVAMVGFEGFKNMTDAVGGVDVHVEEASEGDGKVFREGTMHMDGETALVFVRQRKQLSEGDISRGKRQQAFIKALMLEALSRDTLTNPIRLKDFLDAATSNLTVDQKLDVGTMRSEAIAMRNLPEFVVGFWGAALLGAIVVPLNSWWTGAELGYALDNAGASVAYHDPHVPSFAANGLALESVPLAPSDYDAVVIATAHSGIDYARLVDDAHLVVDLRNATGRAGISSEKVWKL